MNDLYVQEYGDEKGFSFRKELDFIDTLEGKLKKSKGLWVPLPQDTSSIEVLSMTQCAEADAAVINRRVGSFIMKHILHLFDMNKLEDKVIFFLLLGNETISMSNMSRYRGFYTFKSCINFYRNESDIRLALVKKFISGYFLSAERLSLIINSIFSVLSIEELDLIIERALEYENDMISSPKYSHLKYIYKLDGIVYVLAWHGNKEIIKSILVDNFTVQLTSLKAFGDVLRIVGKMDLPDKWKDGEWLCDIQDKDIILWALENNITIQGYDPLLYAIIKRVEIYGKNAIRYAIENYLLTEDKMYLLQKTSGPQILEHLVDECVL